MKKGLILLLFVLVGCSNSKLKMPDFYNKDISELETFTKKHNIKYEIKEAYDDKVEENKILWQNIKYKEVLNDDSIVVVTKSLGKNMTEEYKKYHVDESGNVPIMMYHGISNVKDADTGYTGGNVDRDGYTRTAESLRRDLEFYYQEGYRMIRLKDFIKGEIDVEIGKSPIVLTFDDGLSSNIKVNGIDSKGNIIIDKDSAVGILEEYKKKYPDFNITATFFINGGLFGQPEYNEKILNWLVENGYDIGNHTWDHCDFTTIDINETQEEVGSMYQKLNQLLDNKYVNIVALPFGSPYDDEHSNFEYILKGEYNGFKYNTESTLRVGWESEYSPFSKSFNPQFLKRIRAYDNNGYDFDIEMNFKILKKTRYISDGNTKKVVVPDEYKEYVKETDGREFIYY